MTKTYLKHIYIVLGTLIALIVSVLFLYQWPSALGALAAWVTTGSFSLQVIHIVRRKDTSGVSLGMYAALFFGTASWTFYGFKMEVFPVMIANGLTAVLATVVIMLKLYHEHPLKLIEKLREKRRKRAEIKKAKAETKRKAKEAAKLKQRAN